MPIIHTCCKPIDKKPEPKKPDLGLSLITDAVDNIKRQQEAEELANRQLQEKLKADHERKQAAADAEYEKKLAALLTEQMQLAAEKTRLDNLEPPKPPKQQILDKIQKNEQTIKTAVTQKKLDKQAKKYANLSAGKPSSSK